MAASVHSNSNNSEYGGNSHHSALAAASKYSLSKSFSSNGGDNDSLYGNGHGNAHDRIERRAQRKAERAHKRQYWKDNSAMTTRCGPYSMVVATLIIGIVLALLDVLYIMRYVELQHAPIWLTTSGSATGSGDNKAGVRKKVTTTTILSQENITAMLKAKGPILNLIREAGITFDPVEDADLLEELPDWEAVVQMYGDKPKLYGITDENCQRFQQQSDPGEHMVGVAGTFNTGTNLLAELLIHNCMMPERMKKYGQKNRGVRWQVPWGKHTPPGDEKYRNEHKSKKDWNVNATEIMPAVTIRDPLIWLKSMCKHPYTARWYRPQLEHCPDFSITPKTTSVKYADFTRRHDSILHHWNDYYQEYLQAQFPFMMVRFEDLVFHPKETTTAVCECAGGQMMNRKKFGYIVESAKKGKGAHGKVKHVY